MEEMKTRHIWTALRRIDALATDLPKGKKNAILNQTSKIKVQLKKIKRNESNESNG